MNLSVLSADDSASYGCIRASRGEVAVTALATIFKKIRFHTHENVGWGKIHLPEEQMHTHACWWELDVEMDTTVHQGELEDVLAGITAALANVSPLLVMCDPKDIHAVVQVRSPFTGKPTIFIYDSYPGGIGLAEKLFRLTPQVWRMARDLVQQCACAEGCPGCILGPTGVANKGATLRILEWATGEVAGGAQPAIQ